MKVIIYNRQAGVLGGVMGEQEDEVLGEFCVVVSSLTTFCDKPQYFNVINEDGQFIG